MLSLHSAWLVFLDASSMSKLVKEGKLLTDLRKSSLRTMSW